MSAGRPPLRSLDEALQDLLGRARPLGRTERVATFEADGRVLAQDLRSGLQVPPQDNSSMDGYAVRSAEVARAVAAGAALPVSQRIPAGSAPQPLRPGSVARIFTGAPVPEGADAIVMQEEAQAVDSAGQGAGQGAAQAAEPAVRFERAPQPGQWIRRSGEDVTRGALILQSGDRLTPASLGLAASIGMSELTVAARPRVALMSTGDELVMPGEVAPEDMPPGAIYNSNRFFLRALLQRLGCEVTDLGIVPDQREATVRALRNAAASHDLILTSGGVSVGEEDHVKPAVQQLGSLDLWQIAIKPGKPFAHGRVGEAHFIGLPGNPVSSFVTFLVLVRPFLLRLMGARDVAPPVTRLPAHFDWPRADKRREFLRVRRDAQGGLELFTNQSSGVLTSAVWGEGMVDNPPGQTIAHGDAVAFIAWSDLLS